MTAPRFDLYTLVHKGQRRKLFELTAAAGQLGPDDQEKRQQLLAELEALIPAFDLHAEAEDDYIGPLLAEAAPEAAARIRDEHASVAANLQAAREALVKAVAESSYPNNVLAYRALARFTSAYLAHIEEEEAAQPALWARFEDGKLMQVQGAIVAAHPPHISAWNLRNMLPACSAFERVRFLRGLKSNMPPPAFSQIRSNIEALVDAQDWRAVDAP
jgi:hypothetical protein